MNLLDDNKKKLKSYDDGCKKFAVLPAMLNASQLQSGNLPPNINTQIQIIIRLLYSARIYVDIYGRQQRNTKSIYKLTYKKAIYANIERF